MLGWASEGIGNGFVAVGIAQIPGDDSAAHMKQLDVLLDGSGLPAEAQGPIATEVTSLLFTGTRMVSEAQPHTLGLRSELEQLS